VDGVAVEKPQPGPAALEFGVWFGRAGHCPAIVPADPANLCQGQ